MIARFLKRMSKTTTEANLDEKPTVCPGEDPSSLGNVLMALGVITREELDFVLARKAAMGDILTGAMALEMGFCSAHDIERAVEIQKLMREGQTGLAQLCVQEALTEEMSANNRILAKAVADATTRARERGEKTGVHVLRLATG